MPARRSTPGWHNQLLALLTKRIGVAAPRLRAALDAAFVQHPRLRGYVLDEQGALRPNVVIFIDGARCRERRVLDDALQPDSQVYILQALSGG